MQAAVIEFARDVAGLEGAHSTEFLPKSPHPVIGLITEWMAESGQLETRDENSDLGGSMRLGGQQCRLLPDHWLFSFIRKTLLPNDIAIVMSLIISIWKNWKKLECGFLANLLMAGCRGSRNTWSSMVFSMSIPSGIYVNTQKGHPLFSGFVSAAFQHKKVTTKWIMWLWSRYRSAVFFNRWPCVIESEQLALDTAGYLKELTTALNIPFIYKSSFDKANRSSHESFRDWG